MARTCSVHDNPKRKEIDRALIHGRPVRRVAAEYGIAESSLGRHFRKCLPKAVGSAVAVEAEQLKREAVDVEAELQSLLDQANKRLADASDKDWAGIAKVKTSILDIAVRSGSSLTQPDKVTVTIQMDPKVAAGGED